MQEYLQNLSVKIKVIIGIVALCIIIILFIFAYNYFYKDNSNNLEFDLQNNSNNIVENEGDSVFKFNKEILKLSKEDFLQNLSKKTKIIILIIVIILILLLFIIAYVYFYTGENGEELHIENDSNSVLEEEINDSIFKIESTKSEITVHVVGEVNKPGVFTLKEGARIIDAIEAAGNTTEDADLSKINLAYIIEDGVQIYVPRFGDNREEFLTEDAGEGVIADSFKLDETDSKESKVNINTANVEQLQTLPGVGIQTAQKIIDYREENGKFKSEEDIKNVPGIGDSKYNSLKDKIEAK